MPSHDRDPEYKPIPWYKRQLIVDSQLQWMLLVYSMVLAALSCTLLEIGHYLVQNMDPEGGTFLNLSWQTVTYFLMGMGFFFLIFLVQFQISNRIFGPIHRLKQHMLAIAQGGPVNPLRFREKDHLEGLLIAYNELLKRIAVSESQGGPHVP